MITFFILHYFLFYFSNYFILGKDFSIYTYKLFSMGSYLQIKKKSFEPKWFTIVKKIIDQSNYFKKEI
jgi:hypothetical protein